MYHYSSLVVLFKMVKIALSYIHLNTMLPLMGKAETYLQDGYITCIIS